VNSEKLVFGDFLTLTVVFFTNATKSKIRRKFRVVQIEDLKGINTYFETVGTSNPKHKLRFGEVG